MAKVDAFSARGKAGKAEYRTGTCYPNGVPRSIWYAYPPEFTYKPGNSLLITVLGETREIWMDGRGHPAKPDTSDPATAYLGHSVGWWEGDTLVIDTVGFSPKHELFYDVPNGGAMHTIERYHLVDADHLAVELTVMDPDRLTKPWVVDRVYSTSSFGGFSQPNRIETNDCRPQNDRESIDASGTPVMNMTPPPRGQGLGN
jgi:hypothetical protein